MRIPKVILDAHDYRQKVIEEVCGGYDQEEEDSEQYIQESATRELPDLELTEEYDSVKARTNYALIQLYEQKGYDVFKRTCLNMKANNWFDKGDYGFFKGECAEVYLYVTVLEFIKKFNLSWKAYLSLVIPHRDGVKGHTTELDLVLVSQEMITVFESKSYGGDKTIIDVCTIKRKNGNKDIYTQNALHCESLIKQIKDYNINDQKGMKSVLFSYAEGNLEDSRETKYKKLMPVITEDNILKYLTSLTKLEKQYWKSSIYEKFDELSNKLTMDDHMNYIKGNE